MSEVIAQIENAISIFEGTGHYFSLFFVAIIFMAIIPLERNTYHFYLYSMIAVLIIIFPLTANNIMTFVTGTENYWLVFYILPIFILTAYLGTKTYIAQKTVKEKFIVSLAMFVIFLLVGSYNYQDNFLPSLGLRANNFKLTDETLTVNNILSTNEVQKVMAPNIICSEIREFNPEISLLYGSDTINHQVSNPENAAEYMLITAYDDIQQQEHNLETKIYWAEYFGSNCIIIPKENDNQIIMEQNAYYIIGITEHFIVYKRDI